MTSGVLREAELANVREDLQLLVNSPQRGAAIFQEALTSAAASDIYDLVQKSVDEVPSKDATVARGAARAGRCSWRGCSSIVREASATREAKEFLVDY